MTMYPTHADMNDDWPFFGRVGPGDYDDEMEGLYPKYFVKKHYDPEDKHAECEYFVLDWKHDPFTIPAVLAYADACEQRYPALAADLRAKAKEYSSAPVPKEEGEG